MFTSHRPILSSAVKLRPVFSVIMLVVCLLPWVITAARADDHLLTDKIITLLNRYKNAPPQAQLALHVKLLTPPDRLTTLCAEPELSLSGSLTRLAGPHSIIARCGTQRQFIQIHVDATATWWQAAHLLQPGQIISQDDIRAQRGSLEHLPTGLILDPQRITGRIALRPVRPGENIVESQLRQHWVIRAGQRVEMTWTGSGFKISATGKALDNAALNAHFRVQTPSGQIVTATAVGEGKAAVGGE